MAKHISDKDIEKILQLLDGWKNKLTWDLLCEACKSVIGTKPSRQTLMKFTRVSAAYNATKKRLKEDEKELNVPPTLKVAAERIARLENENKRLKSENIELLEQFVVWQYNAYIHGLNEQELNKRLPIIDRGQTN